MDRLRDLTVTYRRPLIVLLHATCWTCAFVIAVLLRFEFEVPSVYRTILPKLIVISMVVRIVVHWWLGLFHGLLRYAGLRDLRTIIIASTVSSLAYTAIWAFLQPGTFPRSIFVLDWAFSILIAGGLRFSIRTVRELSVRSVVQSEREARRTVLVIGAGDAGEMLMREIVRAYDRRYEPIGFLDDDVSKHGARIHGVAVLGPIAAVGELSTAQRIDEVIVAIPSLRGREMRSIVDQCRPTGAKIRTVPSVAGLIDGRVTVTQLADVNIEDLLGREPVVLDTQALGEFLGGRVMLVTGAGGSIGSELCRQVCRFAPTKLVLVEQAENNLFHIERTLRQEFPKVEIVPVIADICDEDRVLQVFAEYTPHVVFHAAAHKHVPLMEANPGEAVKNNVFGTRKLADSAIRFGVEKFVMVSTDKAVNPTSVMGASKRVAEMYVQSLSAPGSTQFVTVRFGNVLGSAGSVVPLFKEQIAKGGPLTVTHPEMKRYFMTIAEACQLVMQAGAMGRGGEIFVLDMGEPIRIVDLARDLIRLSGLEVDKDIEIRFTGVRPGEKLFEELAVDEEHVDKTQHPKIFVGKYRKLSRAELDAALGDLAELCDHADASVIRGALRRHVPEYSLGEAFDGQAESQRLVLAS